ncbi:MAG: 30S ribosome-binding factor RbfA [Kiritimatiellae bacterium]|nr:30S ribosome-binding factor RbfA [Kiritimatiellia bacterium]
MRASRMVRVNELLKREIAATLYQEMAGESLDFAAITVTDVQVSPDLRHAKVFVSIRGSDAEASQIFSRLYRHRIRLQEHCHRRVRLKYTPVLVFERDFAIERGDRVLALLDQMQPQSPPSAAEPPAGPNQTI